MADLAAFIEAKNKKHSFDEKTKWIAFGGSYPGSLASWVKEKYPDLIHGSISTSGPLLAKADFTGAFEIHCHPSRDKSIFFSILEYYDVVKDSLGTYSADCVNAVEKSFGQVEILLRHRIGQLSLDKKFKYYIYIFPFICEYKLRQSIMSIFNFRLCDPIEEHVNNPLDVANFFENLASNFAGVVQYNKDNSPHATVTIDQVDELTACMADVDTVTNSFSI